MNIHHIFINHWDGACYWNTFLVEDKNPSILLLGNIIAADDLVVQGARTSAAMVLTEFSKNILVSAPEESTFTEV